MKLRTQSIPFRLPAALLVLVLITAMASAAESGINTLTETEKADGWRLLFDGQTSEGWRGFRSQTFPKRGWVIEDGILKKQQGVRGGDIITEEKFTDFEFCWEWRLPEKGNNGVKFFILEERGTLGHEYQMIHERYTGLSSTASFYAVLPPNPDRPPFRSDEWNRSKVLVNGNHVEHWLNGQKVLEYELGSDRVMQGVANSKFKDVDRFGTKVTGHILFTDHGDEAWFRNVKIRELR